MSEVRGCQNCDAAVQCEFVRVCGRWWNHWPVACKPPHWKYWKPQVLRDRSTCKYGKVCDCSTPNAACSSWQPQDGENSK